MRILNRLFAWVFGYFWLPCPICKKMFGGHEVFIYSKIAHVDGHNFTVCRSCNADENIPNFTNLDAPALTLKKSVISP